MAYISTNGVWGDAKEFVGNISKTVSNVQQITGRVAKEGKLKTEVNLSPVIRYTLFGAVGLAIYVIFIKSKR